MSDSRATNLTGLFSRAQFNSSNLTIKTISGEVFTGPVQEVGGNQYIVILGKNLKKKVILFSALESIEGFRFIDQDFDR